MANSPYCDAEDLIRNATACYNEEGAGIYHAALVRKGTTIDKSSPSAFATSILAAESACNAFIIRNTFGSYDGGTAQTGRSYGGGSPKRIGAEHTVTIADPQYVGNEPFWNAFTYQSSQYDLYFFTQNRVWAVTGKAIVVDAKGAIVEDFKEIIEGSIVMKWNDKNNPVSEEFDVPALATFPELALGTVVTNGNETFQPLTNTITATTADGMDTLIPFTDALSYSIPDSTELDALTAAGANVSDIGTGLRIIGDPVALLEGKYTFTVRGTNACGISGSQQFTLVVTV